MNLATVIVLLSTFRPMIFGGGRGNKVIVIITPKRGSYRFGLQNFVVSGFFDLFYNRSFYVVCSTDSTAPRMLLLNSELRYSKLLAVRRFNHRIKYLPTWLFYLKASLPYVLEDFFLCSLQPILTYSFRTIN